MESFKILTWNILGPQSEDIESYKDRYRQVINWGYRFEILLKKIVSYDPDIICLQEIDLICKKAFAAALQKHSFFESSYKQRGESGGVIIFHKISNFEIISNGEMSLPTVNLGPLGACAWVQLECKKNKTFLLIASLHLHWNDTDSQLEKVIKSLKIPENGHIIFTGDFNIHYSLLFEKSIKKLKSVQTFHYNNLSFFEHSSWTAQLAHNTPSICWESFDHIVFSNNLKLCSETSFVGDEKQSYKDGHVKNTQEAMLVNNLKNIPNDTYPSDHLPVVAVFKFV